MKIETDYALFGNLYDARDWIESEIGNYARVEVDAQMPSAEEGRAVSVTGRQVTGRLVGVELCGPRSGRAVDELVILFEHGAVVHVDDPSNDHGHFRIYPQVIEKEQTAK